MKCILYQSKAKGYAVCTDIENVLNVKKYTCVQAYVIENSVKRS